MNARRKSLLWRTSDRSSSLWITLVAVTLLAMSAGSSSAGDKVDPAEFADLMELDHSKFDESSININNPWMPLIPGTQLVYEGFTIDDEDEKIPHRIVFTVTDLVKVINGVQVVVVFDRDYSDEQLEEAELTFFAQDIDGNVWHLGQYYELYDGSDFMGGRAWMVGHLDGAKAGIMMKAKPELGGKSYSQGFAPTPFTWTDRARTYKMGEKTKVAYGTFEDVLVTEEYSREEPGAFQLKYYARGVGVVRVGFRGDDPSQETLELTEINKLSPAEMAQAREEALKLEQHAYVYATTKPATQRPAYQ